VPINNAFCVKAGKCSEISEFFLPLLPSNWPIALGLLQKSLANYTTLRQKHKNPSSPVKQQLLVVEPKLNICIPKPGFGVTAVQLMACAASWYERKRYGQRESTIESLAKPLFVPCSFICLVCYHFSSGERAGDGRLHRQYHRR
jgi:hypothetical protein